MASLLIGALALAYDSISKNIRRRRATKAQSADQFSALEQENAARVARLRERCECGGDHAAEEHPGGRFVRTEEGGRGREEAPPGYEEVVWGRGGGEGGREKLGANV